MTRAWLLNFDADEELARPEGPRKLPTTPAIASRLVRARVLLVPRGDTVLPHAAGATRVLCWMPTRRALGVIRKLGLPAPAAPSFEVLRRVNSRKFSAQLGSGPDGTRWIGHEDELRRALDRGGSWILRAAHGFAGRGRWPVSTPADESTMQFARASFARDGGVELAPRVAITLEAALHGFVAVSGALTLGVPTLSHVDAQGQWRRVSRVRGELAPGEDQALERAAEETGAALHAAGYFGPFGIDAFRYDGPHGAVFCARSEINARYTMAWGRGMAGQRVDLA